MIHLHQPPGAWGSPSVSPFCIKLETYLRMAKVPYERRGANPMKAPKGKVPYVTIDGAMMGDSQLILERLEAKNATPLDASLTPEQRARCRAVRRMIEEGTYWIGVHTRWWGDEGYRLVRAAFLTFLPKLLGILFLPRIRAKVRNALVVQGTARHSPEEIAAMGKADWDTVSTLLGDAPFFHGDTPTTVDATIFAFLWALLAFPGPSPVRDHVRGDARLLAYFDRMRARYFPEAKAAGEA